MLNVATFAFVHLSMKEIRMAEVLCTRCGKSAEKLEKPPLRGKIGQDIYEHVCRSCWEEWSQGEVMLINEYRLNLADPEHRKVLYQNMRQFLNLAE